MYNQQIYQHQKHSEIENEREGGRTVVKVLALPYLRRTRKQELFLISNHWSSDEWVVIS